MKTSIAFLLFATWMTLPCVLRAQEPGTVHFPVSCSEAAQAAFDHAVALLHHMTYPEARKGFERVAGLDPDCAMAHWGVAMTLFQPLWPTRPGPEALRRGYEAMVKAGTMEIATEREQLFLATTAGFFQDPGATDYWSRIRRWADAMEDVYTLLPGDAEAAAFFALAHLATADAGQTHQERAAEILAGVLRQHPDHPGAMHYTIHANDVKGRQAKSRDVVRSYGKVAPRIPHALHMPTHIYVRLGEWENVILGNVEASEAALGGDVGPRGEQVWDEFPHMLGYLVYAHLQRGDDAAAVEQRDRLLSVGPIQPTFKAAFHFAETQARVALERKAWEEAAELVPRMPAYLDWDRFVWPEAVTWFARGLGAVHLGHTREATEAVRRVTDLRAAAERAGEELFAAEIEILRLALSAWMAQRAGKPAEAVALMEAATRLEYATPKQPITPAPILPAFEQLGDLLMEQGNYPDALGAYEMSLGLNPNRFLSLDGAARAALALGETALATTYYDQLLATAASGSERAALVAARGHTSNE